MLQDDLKGFFQGDVATDDATLEKYSRDYSIFKVWPQVVVFPKDVDDVKNLVKFVRRKREAGENISLTGRSAGTDMTGGPLGESVVVEFTKYFNRIKEIGGPSTGSPRQSSGQAGQAYAVVEPGVYFRDLEKELSARGLFYPPYPASKELCAIGGIVANNSGGERTLAYGKTEDYVREMKVVLEDGKEYVVRPLSKSELEVKIKEDSFEGRLYGQVHELIEANYDAIRAAKPDVSKNSAGYLLWRVWDRKTFDLTQLFVGSQGTLGLITEVTLGLVRSKRYRRMAVVFLRDLRALADLIVEILKFKPETLESYDDKTLAVALRFLSGIIRSMKGSFLTLLFQFIPEALMVLRGGLPKMVLLIELASDDERELEERLRALHGEMAKFGVQSRILKSEAEAKKYWTIRRQSFSLLHDHSTGKDTAPFIDDIVVQPRYLPEFLPRLNEILDRYKDKLIYTVAGHPGNGNFHIIPLMDLKDPSVRALIPKISDEVYGLVLRYKGSITAEHNDGLIRSPYLRTMYGEKICGLFEAAKRVFDPLNIFNPGKKVGASLKYALEHITSTSQSK